MIVPCVLERWAEADAALALALAPSDEDGDIEPTSRRKRSTVSQTASAGNNTANATGYTVAITTTACRAWDTDIEDWVISGTVVC